MLRRLHGIFAETSRALPILAGFAPVAPRFVARRPALSGVATPMIRSLLFAAACLAAGAATAHAQTDTGSLRVLVLDQSAGVVPGATLTLTNANTGTSQNAISDGEGYVNFSPIPRGTYNLLTALDGFRGREMKGVTVDVNERKFLRVVLDAAQVSETVDVTAGRRTLQTEEGSLGQVIQGRIAVELPLAGRRYTELALLVPGATPATMTLDTRGPGLVHRQRQYPGAEQLHGRRLRQQPGHAERRSRCPRRSSSRIPTPSNSSRCRPTASRRSSAGPRAPSSTSRSSPAPTPSTGRRGTTTGTRRSRRNRGMRTPTGCPRTI